MKFTLTIYYHENFWSWEVIRGFSIAYKRYKAEKKYIKQLKQDPKAYSYKNAYVELKKY